MVNLLPAISLKMQSYPECIGEVSTRYKSTAAESRMRSRQWELHHCSIVYTVMMARDGADLIFRHDCVYFWEMSVVGLG